MKLIYIFLVSTILFSCKKSSSNTSSENTIEYRVNYTGMTTCNIIYQNEQQQPIGVYGISGWVASIKTSKKPFTATLTAAGSANNSSTPITMELKIYVNGSLVKSDTFNSTISIWQEIQYVIQ